METNRILAEKVMGFTHPPNDFYENWWKDGKAIMHVDAWHPSTDIAQAFEVVEKVCKEKKCSFLLVWHGIAWKAEFYYPITREADTFESLGKSRNVAPSLAICKAALAAIGGE